MELKSALIHQEAVLTTSDPDVAYYYDAGLEMAAAVAGNGAFVNPVWRR